MAKISRRKQQAVTQQDSYRFHQGLDVTARPTHNYSIPRPRSGDAEALADTLNNLTQLTVNVGGIVSKDQARKGVNKAARGEDRPEGLLMYYQQEGFDMFQGKADAGLLRTELDKVFQQMSAEDDGKNPAEWAKGYEKTIGNTIKGFLKGKSDAYVQGIAPDVENLKNQATAAAYAHQTAKLKENGAEQIRKIVDYEAERIYTDPTMSVSDKRQAGRDLITQLQETAGAMYQMDRNEVSLVVRETLEPLALSKGYPELLEPFFVADESGNKLAHTAAGKGLINVYERAKDKRDELIPSRAYEAVRGSFATKTGMDYTGAMKFVEDPENWESLGITSAEQAEKTIGFIQANWTRDRVARDTAKEQIKTETLNGVFDKVYKEGDVDGAIVALLESDIDGSVKDVVMRNLKTQADKSDPLEFNRMLRGIANGTLKNESDILTATGGKIAYPDSQRLLTFMKQVQAPENANYNLALKQIERVITRGGIQLDSYTPIRQQRARDAMVDLMTQVEVARKRGESLDAVLSSDNVGAIISRHTPNITEEVEEQSKSLQAMKDATARIKSVEPISLGQYKVSPGLTDMDAFIQDIIIRNTKKQATPEAINMLKTDPTKMSELNKLWDIYQKTGR